MNQGIKTAPGSEAHKLLHKSKLISSRFTRFLVVGAGNSIINFAVLNFVFYELHQGKIISSIIATTCAIAFSFTLNRSFVFQDKSRPLGKFVRFAFISAGGVLLIQTSIYAVSIMALQSFITSSLVVINLSNLIASFVVMFWNYNGYRLIVFYESRHADKTLEGGDKSSAAEAEINEAA